MNKTVNKIIDDILRVEGSAYTNRASDAGGPTKYGITQRTLARHRGRPVTPEEVAALTEAEARAIYYEDYVVNPGFLGVLKLSERIGVEVIDSGVNCGVGRASEWLQRCLNVFNRQQSDYADIRVDGDVGPATLAALQAFLRKRGASGEVVMSRALNCLQGSHYITLAERRSFDEQNVVGWFLNRVEIAA